MRRPLLTSPASYADSGFGRRIADEGKAPLNALTDAIDSVQLSIPINEGVQAPSASVNCAWPVHSISKTKTLSATVSAYVSAAVADNTRRAYRQDLADLERWGGSVPCTPETLAAFIADRATTLSPHTITRRVVGISKAHTSSGYDDPAKNDLVRAVLRGVRRSHGKAQRQATPLLKHDLMAILPLMVGPKGLRDRALLMLGFAAALRRSELVALNYADLQFVAEGLIVHLRRSKTDQQAEGRKIAVPYGRTSACAVKALSEWLEHSQITSGAVFRAVSKGGHVSTERLTPQSVALVVKHYAKLAGLAAADFSGHSLRAGLVTSAAMAGVAIHRIMAQTGHRSIEMVSKYVRDASLFDNNAAGFL